MKNLNFKKIIQKYFKRNKDYILSENVLHEMNGAVLSKTGDNMFDFNGEMAEEVREYCKEQGFKIDKIVFVSSYDIEVDYSKDYNLKMEGNSSIKIIKENDKIIAILCIGEYVKIKNIGYEI